MIAAGDTKVVERGNADGLYVNTAGIGVVPAAVELGPERVRPGDRVLVSGTLGDHGMAVLVARGDLDAGGRPDERHGAGARARRRAARARRRPLDARSDARRPRHRAERARRARPVSRSRSTRRRCRCARRSSAPARSSGSIRSTSPTRASSSPSSRPSAPTRRSPRCAAIRSGAEAGDRRRGARRARRDGAAGHRVRRQPHRRHARRRPAAAHLLTLRRAAGRNDPPLPRIALVDRLRPLWDFDDLDLSERRFTEQLDREVDDAGRAEVLTQLARVEGLRGAYDRCGDLLDEAARVGAGQAVVDVRVALERGRMLRSSGDPTAAYPLFVTAFELGEHCRRVLPRGRRGAHGGTRSAGRRRLSRLDDARDRARRAGAGGGLLARTAPEQPRLAAPRARRARRGAVGVRARPRGSGRRPVQRVRDRDRPLRGRRRPPRARTSGRGGGSGRARGRLVAPLGPHAIRTFTKSWPRTTPPSGGRERPRSTPGGRSSSSART